MEGGLGFGVIGERRPFGNNMLGHLLVVYFATVARGLLVLRVAISAHDGRPDAIVPFANRNAETPRYF